MPTSQPASNSGSHADAGEALTSRRRHALRRVRVQTRLGGQPTPKRQTRQSRRQSRHHHHHARKRRRDVRRASPFGRPRKDHRCSGGLHTRQAAARGVNAVRSTHSRCIGSVYISLSLIIMGSNRRRQRPRLSPTHHWCWSSSTPASRPRHLHGPPAHQHNTSSWA